MTVFSLSGITITITALILTIALFVYGKTKLHKIWTLFNLAVLDWGIGCFLAGQASSPEEALLAWRIAIAGGLFIGVFFYHTMSVFSGFVRKKILLVVYVQAFFFLLLTLTTEHTLTNWRILFNHIYYPRATFFYTLMVVSWVIVVYLGHQQLVYVLRNSRGRLHIQAKYLFAAFLIGFIGGSLTLIPAFNINIYPAGNFGIPIYTLTVTYAILRHRLMDIHLVLRKSMVYSLSAGILTSLFVVLVISMTKFLSNIAGISSFAITAVAALTIAILFNPIKNKIQSFIDKSFYKKSYDYYPTIRDISRKLTSIFDLNELFNYVGDMILSTLGLSNIYLLHAVPGRGYEIVYHKSYKKDKDKKTEGKPESDGEGKIRKSSELVNFFKKSDEILIKDELPGFERALGLEIIERIKSDLKPFNGEAVVPVFIDKKLMLLLILGEKLSGDMFTNEDINLLNIVSNQIAIAIKNAELYKDKVRTERLASMGMMSATFAHEIRNPLTSLKTFAQLMPEKYNDEEFRDTFSRIVVGEIERIDGLIGDLLDFSSDKKLSRVNFFDLTALVDDIVDYVRGKIEFERKNILFNKNYGKEEINMSGDAEKLKQAFINIITNGCQAMNGEGTLTVSIKQNSKFVDIAITDTGEGINEDDILKIFDPFVTTKDMGIGLGLAISRRIIEDHQGKINVKSKVSKGTTFTVTLPVQND